MTNFKMRLALSVTPEALTHEALVSIADVGINERHLLPGEGKNDWKAVITALNDVGYSGRFLYELRQGYTYAQIVDNYRSLMEKLNK